MCYSDQIKAFHMLKLNICLSVIMSIFLRFSLIKCCSVYYYSVEYFYIRTPKR